METRRGETERAKKEESGEKEGEKEIEIGIREPGESQMRLGASLFLQGRKETARLRPGKALTKVSERAREKELSRQRIGISSIEEILRLRLLKLSNE